MIRRPFVLLLAALVAFPLAAGAASSPSVGRWAISSNRQDDAGKVSLLFVYERNDARGFDSSSWSSGVALSEVGLTPARLGAPIAPYAFKVVRDPGTFDCVGTVGEGLGGGQFTFSQSTGFGDALASRGVGHPTLEQSLTLAIAGTTVAFVDDISKAGIKPSIDDLVRLAQHGVGPRYVAELAAAGYRIDNADSLMRMRDHGVNANSIHALQAAGFKNLSTDDLVRLADHGVRESFITGLAAAGYKLSPDDLVRFADHGVRAAFIADLAKAGYTHLSADDLVKLADRGVRASYIDDLAKHGYTRLPVDDLIRLRDHGVTVAYIDRLQSHGYKNLPVNDLIRLRDSGI